MQLGAVTSLAALAASAAACVLVVPSGEPSGPHCAFAGADTPCGRCLREQCIAAVDPCCKDDSCGGAIADVEACAARGDESCARLASLWDKTGAERDLSACVAGPCGDVCRATSGGGLTRCRPAYVTSKDACTCEVSDAPNATACTSVGHPALRCCAPEGWPGPALACDCLAVICLPLNDGCTCQLSTMDDRGRPTECDGEHCCVDATGFSCSCGSRACAPNETEVPSCGIDQLGCAAGRHEVASCSGGP